MNKRIRDTDHYRLLLFIITGIHAVIFTFVSLFRYWGNLTSFYDLANFNRILWNIYNSIVTNSDIYQNLTHRFSIHFDPILFIFVPFYALNSHVAWLVAAHALAISLAAWPIFLLASRIFQSNSIALLWAIIYLINPFVLNAASWDFHPVVLAIPFIALSFLALESKNFKLMLFCTLVILLCKEHLGVMVIGFGILWWNRTRQWIPGTALVLLGAAHFYLVLQVIMPAFSPTGQHVMVSEGLGQLSRYAWLGDSFGDIVRTLTTQPFYVLKTVLISMGGLVYLVLLLIPFLFFPLLGLIYLLPGMADLAANMLSNISMPRSPISYHSATLIPIFTVAAMYGVKNASRWVKKFSTGEFSLLVLIASLTMGYLLAPFPLPGALNYWAPASYVSLPDPRVHEIRSLAGKDASISAQANIGAHFSQRLEIYRFPNRKDQVDYIILHLDSPTTRLVPTEPGPLGTLADHLQLPIAVYLNTVKQMLKDEDYAVAYWDDPWLVIQKGMYDTATKNEIINKIGILKKEWLHTDNLE